MMSNFQVPVDDTITQLTVLLTSPSAAPVCMTMMPLGNLTWFLLIIQFAIGQLNFLLLSIIAESL